MASPQTSQRWKLVSIPLLAAVLIYLVIPADEPAPVAASLAAGSPTVVDASTMVVADQAAMPDAPLPTLAELLAADPFAPLERPKPVVDPVTTAEHGGDASPATVPDSPPEVRISAIYQSPAGPVAIVDNRLIRVGDQLSPHFRVIGIDDRGIHVTSQQP